MDKEKDASGVNLIRETSASISAVDSFFRCTVPLDYESATLEKLGGKGLNLTKLIVKGGFNVPPGFVVTVNAYRDFVRVNDLSPIIEKALSESTTTSLSTNEDGTINALFEAASQTIRDAFRRGSLPQDLIRELQVRMTDLMMMMMTPSGNTAVAVRSSATAEDLPDMSFAGQQDTYLNVKGLDAVQSSIIDCFSSLYTARAIGYRQRNNISHSDDTGIAVVVQSMVDAECSGVLFTANPLTGRRDESVLEVVPGLGEALVSGLTDPDRYVVGTDGIIVEKRVGAKKLSIRPAVAGGVQRCCLLDEHNEDKASSPVLDDDTVRDLVRLGRRIENSFGGIPQDIEWARYQGTNYILQSRPITTLFPLPDGMPAEPLKVMLSFGAVQGIAGPVTPAGQDTLRLLIGGASTILYGNRGIVERRKQIFRVAAERLFLDFTSVVCNSAGRRFVHKVLPVIEPGIAAGLKQVENDPRLAVTGGLSPRFFVRVLSLLPIVLPRYLYALFCPDGARQRLFSMADQIVAKVQKSCDGAHNLQEVLNVHEEASQSIFPSIILHFVPRMGVAMGSLFQLRRLATKIPDGRDLVLMLTRGLPYNVTTEMDLRLWKVAQQIRDDTKSSDWFRRLDAEELASGYLEKQLPENAQMAIEDFMIKYGMRGLAEIDFGQARWREDPTPLMQTLKSYIDIEEERAPDRVFTEGAKVAADAESRLARELGMPRLVAFFVRRIRALAGLRELPKFTAIRCMGIIRQRMLVEAERLVDLKVLASPKDIFMLHLDELKALAAEENRDWSGIAAARRAHLEFESRRKRIPQLLASDGFSYYGGATSVGTRPEEEGNNVLCGEPVSPGTAEGKVRVVLNPARTQLLPGEVLVCPGTDPSWTPLFLSASALVMEVGGLMTHGSVVAREYGIPAVVGVQHVTEKLKTGQTVWVNGSTGVVRLVDEAT